MCGHGATKLLLLKYNIAAFRRVGPFGDDGSALRRPTMTTEFPLRQLES
jgi:hypothetical protein